MDKECIESGQALENCQNEKQAIGLELSESKEKVNRLQYETDQLSSQIDDTKSKFQEECEKTTYLRLELKNSNGKVKILETQINSLQENLDTVRAEYAGYQQQKEQEMARQNIKHKLRVVQ